MSFMNQNASQKFLLRFFLCFILFGNAWIENTQAQMVYIPDSMFKVILTGLGFGSCIIGDSIDSSCPSVANRTLLDVSNFNIHDLQGIQAFGNLRSLSCNDNQLANLPALPIRLTDLSCFANQLTSLPNLPDSLRVLECMNNQLTSLPALPITLTYLRCSENLLTALPILPTSLQVLRCYNNQISTLPALPNSLIELDCWNNMIGSLPSLPNSLQTLSCGGNNLVILPPLPGSLLSLFCGANPLVSLPTLPDSLIFISCHATPITSLPDLPASLRSLWCHQNQLTVLPLLPNSLSTLDCSGNQLTYIPELPDSLYAFWCQSNLNLFCLPELKQITNLNFWNTPIACLPNYGNVTNSTPLLSSLPLCGVFNTNGCNSYYNISGKSYFDVSPNCSFNSGDVEQRNVHILLYKNGTLIQQAYTGEGGLYSFDVSDSLGAYTVQLDTSHIPFTVLCPASATYQDTITSTDSLFYNNDFALTCKSGFDVGAWSIEGMGFTPGRVSLVKIQVGDLSNFYGANCANGISGTVVVTINGGVNYIGPASGALVPNASGNTLTYVVPDFGDVNIFSSFNIVVATDTSAALGSQVCFTISIPAIPGDHNLSNNILNHCFTIRGSYDPNEKVVYPPGNIDPSGDKWLTYTIHFQNTGTAAAEHIYITDTLDQNLDLLTFQLLAYSHQPLVQILEGGVTHFNFPNINLPDSNSSEPLSHGFIKYKIKFKDSLSIGTQIQNTAYIYFDFNSPVETNTTLNTLDICITNSQNINASICDDSFYNFNGQFLTQAGIYTDTILSSFGCDSVVSLVLQILPTADTNVIDILCVGDTYNFNGQSLSVPGNYVDTLLSSTGCDSVIALQLSLSQADTSVTMSGGTLSSIVIGSIYQWIDCITGNPIPGGNAQIFQPSASGIYALVITQNNCTDTSSCYPVIVSGISKGELNTGVTIFPNPTKEAITVFSVQFKVEKIELFSLIGERLYEKACIGNCNEESVDVSPLSVGIYFVKVSTEKGIATFKVVKE